MKRLCTVYKSQKKDEMYLYVDKNDGLELVPAALLEHFGEPQLALHFVLHEERTLARVDVIKVVQAIDEQGFYLQLPPQPEHYMLDLVAKNSKVNL